MEALGRAGCDVMTPSGRRMARWEAARRRPREVVWRWAPGLGGYDVRHVGAHWRASQWCEVLEAFDLRSSSRMGRQGWAVVAWSRRGAAMCVHYTRGIFVYLGEDPDMPPWAVERRRLVVRV